LFARYSVALVSIATLLCACDEGTVSPTIVKSPSLSSAQLVSTEWQNPYPQGNNLNRMWGFPDGSFLAVGDAGTVLSYKNGSWAFLECGVREDLHSVWASSASDVYVAGLGGTLVRYDGSKWSKVSIPSNDDFYAVWLNSDSDLFVTGAGGRIQNRYNGTWTSYAAAPGKRLRALLGYSHTEVYASGSDATLLRFNGATWNNVTIGIALQGDAEFRDLWGPGPGQFGFISGYGVTWTDGVSWSFIPEANGYFAYGCWGASLDDQVMVAAGLSSHLQNGSFAWYPIPTTEPLYDVWGVEKDNYYAVGRSGSIAHFTGSGWQALSHGPINDLRDVWVAPTSAVAVGAEGTILRQSNGQWIADNVDPGYDLSGVWQSAGKTIAVGRYTSNGREWREAILMSDGGSWEDPGPIGGSQRLFDVWGSTASDVLAVGWAGEVLQYDGNQWQAIDVGAGNAAFLKSVSGSASNNVVAVGRTNDHRGLVCRFDGQTWTQTEFFGVEEFTSVWVASPQVAFAVGTRGEIRQLYGDTWNPMDSPTSTPLFALWGSSATDVYAAGLNGTVFHFDGLRWKELLPATNRTFRAIGGRAGSDVYLAGDRGAILLLGETAGRPRRHERDIYSSLHSTQLSQ
jgi:hypothetical protein